jgi:hypothetical protein
VGVPLTAYPCRPFTVVFIRRGEVLLIRVVTGIATGEQGAPGDGELIAFCSPDGWAACAPCAGLIDAGDVHALGQRMLACLAGADLPPMHRTVIEGQIIATLRGFWRHRPCVN